MSGNDRGCYYLRFLLLIVIMGAVVCVAIGTTTAAAPDVTDTEENSPLITNKISPTVQSSEMPTSIATRENQITLASNQPNQTRSAKPYHERKYQTTDALDEINASAVWTNFNTKGEGTTVAIVDTGVDTESYPGLEPIDGGWKDVVYNEKQPYDVGSHGTSVAGIVTGGQDWEEFHSGVAPDAEMIMVQAFQRENEEYRNKDLTQALEWLVTHEEDIDVIVMPLGGDYDEAHVELIEEARSQGIVVVASIGNEGEGTSGSPANYYNTLSVGATDGSRTNTIADYSGGEEIDTITQFSSRMTSEYNWPEQYTTPDVAAPGSNSFTAEAGDDHRLFGGTSAAAPYVGGTVALMQSATDQELEPEEIEDALRSTAIQESPDASPGTRKGHGIIDAHRAVNKVTDKEPAHFEVQETNYISPTDADEPHQFEAVIKNVGGYEVTRQIRWFSVPAISARIGSERESLTLSRGEQQTVTTEIDSIEPLLDSEVEKVPWDIKVDDTVYIDSFEVDSLDDGNRLNGTDDNSAEPEETESNEQEGQSEPATETDSITDDNIPGFDILAAMIAFISTITYLRQSDSEQ